MDQAEIWIKNSSKKNAQSVIDEFNNPFSFQTEFVDFMQKFSKEFSTGNKLLECGSDSGITSMLLAQAGFKCTCIDINEHALELGRIVAKKLDIEINFQNQDMFFLNFSEQFDIIFNNGVLEHFNLKERTDALESYTKNLRKGGYIIIGIPNHLSVPYRVAYFLRLLIRKWPYPSEIKIKDFHRESDKLTLNYIDTIVLDKDGIYNFYPGILKRIATGLFSIIKPEGYLRVLIYQKF